MKNVQNPILSTDERRRYLDKLQRQVKRLGRLTDGLTFLHTLDVARQGEFIPRSIHLRKFIEECIEEIQHNYPYVHTFEIVGQGDCTYVYVDDNLLYQILIHLLSNAVKYSAPQHPITIKCDCTHPTELYLEIEDHGVGIPQGEQAHIFAPFYRAQNVKHIEGSGLGLTTVEKAVQICGGSLGFVSEENRGSRFWVRVPRLNSQGDG
jgi:signal transduction histidine kinase